MEAEGGSPLVDGVRRRGETRHDGHVLDEKRERLERVLLPALRGDGLPEVGQREGRRIREVLRASASAAVGRVLPASASAPEAWPAAARRGHHGSSTRGLREYCGRKGPGSRRARGGGSPAPSRATGRYAGEGGERGAQRRPRRSQGASVRVCAVCGRVRGRGTASAGRITRLNRARRTWPVSWRWCCRTPGASAQVATRGGANPAPRARCPVAEGVLCVVGVVALRGAPAWAAPPPGPPRAAPGRPPGGG